MSNQVTNLSLFFKIIADLPFELRNSICQPLNSVSKSYIYKYLIEQNYNSNGFKQVGKKVDVIFIYRSNLYFDCEYDIYDQQCNPNESTLISKYGISKILNEISTGKLQISKIIWFYENVGIFTNHDVLKLIKMVYSIEYYGLFKMINLKLESAKNLIYSNITEWSVPFNELGSPDTLIELPKELKLIRFIVHDYVYIIGIWSYNTFFELNKILNVNKEIKSLFSFNPKGDLIEICESINHLVNELPNDGINIEFKQNDFNVNWERKTKFTNLYRKKLIKTEDKKVFYVSQIFQTNEMNKKGIRYCEKNLPCTKNPQIYSFTHIENNLIPRRSRFDYPVIEPNIFTTGTFLELIIYETVQKPKKRCNVEIGWINSEIYYVTLFEWGSSSLK